MIISSKKPIMINLRNMYFRSPENLESELESAEIVDSFDAEAGLPSLEEEVGEGGEEGGGGENTSIEVTNRGRRSRKISMVERGRYASARGPSPFRNNFVDVRV